MISIIDYGVGNLGSVLKAFKYLNIPVTLTSKPQQILNSEGVILPGVGAFGEGIRNLKNTELDKTIIEVVEKNKPFLGICLGLQLLFKSSEENPGIEGLNLIKGKVKKFELDKVNKIPHMGWNQVNIQKNDPLFNNLGDGKNFYFVHSYYVQPEDSRLILGTTRYGDQEFVSVIKKNNLWALQCHPEKSSKKGLQVLKKFSEVAINGSGSDTSN